MLAGVLVAGAIFSNPVGWAAVGSILVSAGASDKMTRNQVEEIKKKYIEVMIRINSANGSLKPHSGDALTFIWCLFIGLSAFAYGVAYSWSWIITTITFISVLFLITGSALFKKTGYKWFLYHVCIGIGILASIVNPFFANAIYNENKPILLLTILLSVCICVGISYFCIETVYRIRKGWDGTNTRISENGLWIAWFVGPVILSIIFGDKDVIFPISACGLFTGYYIAALYAVYLYGKKHDSNEDLLRRVQAEIKEDDIDDA